MSAGILGVTEGEAQREGPNRQRPQTRVLWSFLWLLSIVVLPRAPLSAVRMLSDGPRHVYVAR